MLVCSVTVGSARTATGPCSPTVPSGSLRPRGSVGPHVTGSWVIRRSRAGRAVMWPPRVGNPVDARQPHARGYFACCRQTLGEEEAERGKWEVMANSRRNCFGAPYAGCFDEATEDVDATKASSACHRGEQLCAPWPMALATRQGTARRLLGWHVRPCVRQCRHRTQLISGMAGMRARLAVSGVACRP